MSRELVPLRVPSGWAVIFNIFVEIPDRADLTAQEIDSFLTEDILSIEQLRLAGPHWETDPEGTLIDLSWSDSGSIDGEYVLTVVPTGWDGPTATLRDDDQELIRTAIELVFTEVRAGRTTAELTVSLQQLTQQWNVHAAAAQHTPPRRHE